MITVNSGGHSHLFQSGGDKLKQSHLCSGILHSHTIGAKTQVRSTAHDVLVCGIVQMRVQHLLGESQWAVQATAHHFQALVQLLVRQVDVRVELGQSHFGGGVAGGVELTHHCGFGRNMLAQSTHLESR